ncbi:MAG TPA: c-type cytochrome domain-containing protein [Chloroflexota bacterium]
MRSSTPRGRAIIAFAPLLFAAVALAACAQPAAQPTPTPQPSAPAAAVVPPAWKLVWNGHYAQNIQPIFNQRCVSCHGPNRADKQLKLDSFDAVMKGSQDGPVVVPGSLTASPLLSTVDGTATGSSRMPPTGPQLPETEVQNLRVWIEAGAPSN